MATLSHYVEVYNSDNAGEESAAVFGASITMWEKTTSMWE